MRIILLGLLLVTLGCHGKVDKEEEDMVTLAPRHEGVGISWNATGPSLMECPPPEDPQECFDRMFRITAGSISGYISLSDYAAIVDIDYDYGVCAPVPAFDRTPSSVPVTPLVRFDVVTVLKNVIEAPTLHFYIGGCCDGDGLCCFEPGCFPGYVWSGRSLVIGQHYCRDSTPDVAHVILDSIYAVNDTEIFDRRGQAQSWPDMQQALDINATQKSVSYESCLNPRIPDERRPDVQEPGSDLVLDPGEPDAEP